MSPAHKTHRGPLISMSWKTSLPVSGRFSAGGGARARLPQVLAQIDAGPRVLFLFQPAMQNSWVPELQAIVKENHSVFCFELPDGENCKSADSLFEIWNVLQKEHFDRHDTVVAIGGGAVTDVAGFAAATYLRGLKLVLLPTTLLSQVDAAIGGKTAINLPAGKNLAGSFYFPQAVIVDPEFLSTLPQREFVSGLGEIVKYALIEETVAANSEYRAGPKPLLDMLEAHMPADFEDSVLPGIITACIKMKLAVVGADPTEAGLRRCLNLGHTLGHALEKVSKFALSHGEAVSIGLVFALKTAIAKRKIGADSLQRLYALLQKAGLPAQIPAELAPEQLLASMLQDKKRQGSTIKFILPNDHLGKVDYDCSIKLEDLEKLL